MEVRFVDTVYGHATFALRPFKAGAVIAVEDPVVATQQLAAKEAWGVAKCCPMCLAFTSSLSEEVDRLKVLLLASQEANAKVDSAMAKIEQESAEFAAKAKNGFAFPWFHDSLPEAPYCSRQCANAAEECWLSKLTGVVSHSSSDVCREIFADDIVSGSAPTASSRTFDEAVQILAYLARTFNERIWTVLELLVKVASSYQASRQTFSEAVDELLVGYADGSFGSLCKERLALLRYARELSLRCLNLLVSDIDDVSLSLQQYALCFRVLDANIHTCIVINPLWSLWRHLESMATLGSTQHVELREALATVFSESTVSDGLHNHGVALYKNTTKLNHSCSPNVRFWPTEAPARARVLARRDIAAGEELRTSYIDVDDESGCNEFGDVVKRRAYLKRCYDFDCDCDRCNKEIRELGERF